MKLGRFWPSLRLRSKLALSLSIAALVPVIVITLLSVRFILGSLDRGLQRDAERQRDIGLNLLLRSVERTGDALFRLSEQPTLADALSDDSASLSAAIDDSVLPASLLQILTPEGLSRTERVRGGDPERFAAVAVGANDPVVLAARSYRRRVTFEVREGQLLMRASSPVLSDSLQLRGIVVLTVLLDDSFADRTAASLGANVILATSERSWTTFRDSLGQRYVIVPPRLDPQAVLRGEGLSIIELRGIEDPEEHQVAWIALIDHERKPVAWLGVALPRRVLAAARAQALRSIVGGGLAALIFSVGIAVLLARRLGRPIARLHTGAVAVARGDLDYKIDVPPGDEIADLAAAFSLMTSALKDNQMRLAARMREIVALHDAGRAVSSEIDLPSVTQKTAESIVRTFDARLCVVWLTAARTSDPLLLVATSGRDQAVAEAYRASATKVVGQRMAIRSKSAGADALAGPILAVPLERNDEIFGAIVVARSVDDRQFAESDASLLATFADQAASAIDNARLYEQVSNASAELDRKVRLRTAELTAMNGELGRAIHELREAQAQLVLSERMAGLGLLVAGVAHEINSPSAAIRGSVDAFGGVIRRIGGQFAALAAADIPSEQHQAILVLLDELAPRIASRRMLTGPAVRHHARALRADLAERGLAELSEEAPRLAEFGLEDDELAQLLLAVKDASAKLTAVVVDSLGDHVFLHRSVSTIHSAIGRIQRIVGALKSYSHVDQDAARIPADLHSGIETTLTLFHHLLRDIEVHRSFATLPLVPVFIDELNQVWTNLIQNAVQALNGNGTITIETKLETDWAVVRVIDDGPGIPADLLPRIFDPFFTTKRAGEGTGLGLGIVRRIVVHHGGEMTCTSAPGSTVFEVRLPLVESTPLGGAS